MFNTPIEKIRNFIASFINFHFISGMFGAAILLLILHLIQSPKSPIATIDITKIVNQFVQSQMKLNLPKPELQKRVKVFGNQLEITLNHLAKDRHLVLLPAEAVIAGSTDLTPVVQSQMQNLLNPTS